jgi:hypothetical protein
LLFFSPPIQNRGGRQGGLGRRRRPGVGGGRKQGKTERGMRATYPVSHLGRGRPVEVAPQRRAAAGSAARLAARWSARREGEMA